MRSVNLTDAEVRGILSGVQTVLYRPVKIPRFHDYDGHRPDGSAVFCSRGDQATGSRVIPFPFGAPGDLLIGRESWCPRITGHYLDRSQRPFYRATDGQGDKRRPHSWGWSSSAQMPVWASRIQLRLEEVRAHRIQELAPEDAKAAGIPQMHFEAVTLWLCAETRFVTGADGPTCRDVWDNQTSVENFRAVWDATHKWCDRWNMNPPVWRVRFTVVLTKYNPFDQRPAGAPMPAECEGQDGVAGT